METLCGRGTSRTAVSLGETQSLVVDGAISHCETLRRILELEAWIREARVHPILERACARWQAEREQLMAQLGLSP
jgi:hypothetical protein